MRTKKMVRSLMAVCLTFIICIQMLVPAEAGVKSTWKTFENASYASATQIKPDGTVKLTANSTGGYSPTGYFAEANLDNCTVVKVRYEWRVVDERLNQQTIKSFGWRKVNSPVSFTTGKLKTGYYTYICVAYGALKNGEVKYVESKYIHIQVGMGSWKPFENLSSVSSKEVKPGESVKLLGLTSGGYSPTGFNMGAVSDDVVKVRYRWYITGNGKFNELYKSTGYYIPGKLGTISTGGLSEGEYVFSCIAIGVTKSGKEIWSDRKNINVNVCEPVGARVSISTVTKPGQQAKMTISPTGRSEVNFVKITIGRAYASGTAEPVEYTYMMNLHETKTLYLPPLNRGCIEKVRVYVKNGRGQEYTKTYTVNKTFN